MALIKVIIPAYNEADSIGHVINDIPNIVDEIIVVSNNSTDATDENAQAAGAVVLRETRKGYGQSKVRLRKSFPHFLSLRRDFTMMISG